MNVGDIMADIFISYSRKDKAFATKLHEALEVRQRQAWVDLEDIPPSAEWREKIKSGIEGARAFVIVLSPDSIISSECLKEIDYAAANHKRFIPVVSREFNTQTIPESLGKFNWIFIRDQDDFDKGVDTLLTAVDTDLEWVDAHTDLLEKAVEWDHKGRDSSLLLRGRELRVADSWISLSSCKEPQPTELMATFIVTSRQGETRRQRYLLGGVSIGLVVALVLAAVAFYQYLAAEKRGKISLSRQLAAQSQNLLASQPDLAILLSVEACQIEATLEAEISLRTPILKWPQLTCILRGGGGEPFAISPNSKFLAAIDDNFNTIRVWDLTTSQPMGQPLTLADVSFGRLAG
jgi:hypothetical protein